VFQQIPLALKLLSQTLVKRNAVFIRLLTALDCKPHEIVLKE